jgi:anti-sigma factor RsiW
MSTCRDVAERLAEFVGGTLLPEGRAALEHHLEGCPSCRDYLGGYCLSVHLGRDLPVPPLPGGLARRLRAMLEERRGE